MPRRTHTRATNTIPEPAEQVRRTTVKSPGFVSIYANDVQVQTSPWDIRLLLGEIANFGAQDDLVVTVNLLADLRFSPQLAKRLTVILAEQLRLYEEKFGRIPGVPEG